MSLKTYDEEEIKRMPMIDVANAILQEEKDSLHFKKMFEQISDTKGFTESQKKRYIAQFYTDLNMDGRFITIGDNLWGLKRWYPASQIDEQISNPSLKTEDDEEGDLDVADDEMADLIEDEEEVEGFDEDSEEDESFDAVDDEEFPTYKDDED